MFSIRRFRYEAIRRISRWPGKWIWPICKAPQEISLIPKDGNIIGTLSIAVDKDVRMTGTLDFRQAGFIYKDKPLTITGLVTLTGEKITSDALKIRHDQMTIDMNGTLTLDKIPYLKGDVVVDKLSISVGAESGFDMLKKFQGNVQLKLTNLTYNGIFIQKGIALAELGPAGLRLKNLELSDKTGTVKGTVILSPDGQFGIQSGYGSAKRSRCQLHYGHLARHASMDGRPHGFARTGVGEKTIP